MKHSQISSNRLLRSLIKEYLVNYTLPKLDNRSITSDKSTSDMASGLFKAGVGAIAALLGYNAFFGSESGSSDKNPIDSFASNVSNSKDILSAGSDAIDILTLETFVRRTLQESGETFRTKYGPVKSDLIDNILISNIKAAQKKVYFNFPDDVKIDTAENFKSSLQPVIGTVRDKVGALFAIVSKDQQAKSDGFPSDFSQFGLTLKDVDQLTDIANDPNELVPANAAMSDAISTAIFNQIKYEVITFIGLVDEAYKKAITETDKLPPYETALKVVVRELNSIITPVGNVRGILVK